ncbi:MAG: TAXI family TRAP transporter solute-binding subunit [Hyphomicrobiaceae bacterium]|nr:TAXI family TRAP transporter solute-binding subunit [Hyphomicrobiaceae bacterium]
MRMKRGLLALGLVVAAAGMSAAVAQTPAFFRIGTGGTGGTYYPVGGMIANAISNPPQLVSTAVASNGSVANVNAIAGGNMDSGFSQADVAYWAYSGTGVFDGKPKITDLRAIANLYPESVHIVVRKGSGLKSVADLKGKRVSLDEPGSGSLINARAVLAAYGITEKDIKPEYLKPNQAAEKMKDGSVDAFFITGGYPMSAISELATSGGGVELLPIDGAGAAKLMKDAPFFAKDEIPAGTYKDVGATPTLAVGAQWVTSAKIPDEVVYSVVKAMWSDKTRAVLDAGHAKGKLIRKESALNGLAAPLHPGAEKFYKEAGLLK